MTLPLSHSYAYCERLARREAGNFYHAFRILSRPQQRAMCALYSFLRIADDLADGPGTPAQKQAALLDWRTRLDRALRGDYSHRLHPALHDTVQVYGIPRVYLDEVLDGVTMDLVPIEFTTFDELYGYCYRVASAVGLACIYIWRFRDEGAKAPAINAGIAFQLTNILRDLGEDAVRSRVYLPRAELAQFDYDVQQLCRGERNERFRELMRFQVARARRYYAEGWPLTSLLPPAGRAVFQVMMRTYGGLLDAIEGRDYDVFSSRVRLSTCRKLCLLLQALPVRWGWT